VRSPSLPQVLLLCLGIRSSFPSDSLFCRRSRFRCGKANHDRNRNRPQFAPSALRRFEAPVSDHFCPTCLTLMIAFESPRHRIQATTTEGKHQSAHVNFLNEVTSQGLFTELSRRRRAGFVVGTGRRTPCQGQPELDNAGPYNSLIQCSVSMAPLWLRCGSAMAPLWLRYGSAMAPLWRLQPLGAQTRSVCTFRWPPGTLSDRLASAGQSHETTLRSSQSWQRRRANAAIGLFGLRGRAKLKDRDIETA